MKFFFFCLTLQQIALCTAQLMRTQRPRPQTQCPHVTMRHTKRRKRGANGIIPLGVLEYSALSPYLEY